MVLIGAGNRGRGTFGQYALSNAEQAAFVAVVEPDEEKRLDFARAHGISAPLQFRSVTDFFEKHPEKIADALIIAASGTVRAEPVSLGMKAGYAVLCEKPLALTPQASIAVTDSAREHPGIFMVCHQMRYMPIFHMMKQLVSSGRYGRIVNVEHSENVSFEHMAHTFARGVFNNDAVAPMILAKSCHDMDWLQYLIAARPLRISSFGGLDLFRPENAPQGAPAFCLDGCPAAKECPYDVRRIYFRPDTDPAYLRQMGVVRDHPHLLELLKTNRYGRCVYRCDNNVVDHQVCAMEFEGGVTVSFVLAGYNGVERRRTRIQMTEAELDLDTSRGTILVHRSTGDREVHTPATIGGTHLGGDHAIMQNFVQAVATGRKEFILTSVSDSLESHLLAFAAETSRQSRQTVEMFEYERNLRSGKWVATAGG